MITAEQAREATITAKKDLVKIYEAIEVMSRTGANYAAFTLNEIREPQNYKTELEEVGFTVEIIEQNNYFHVTW